MGDAFAYKCRKCGYEEYFNQGYGFMVHPQTVKDYLSLKMQLFHYKTHNKIVKLSGQQKDLRIKAAFQIYICPNCELLYDKAEVKIYNENKTVHQSRFRCSDCNSRLKLTNIHRLNHATCPVCKKKSFKRNHTQHILWD